MSARACAAPNPLLYCTAVVTPRAANGRLVYLLLVPILVLSFRPVSDMDFWWHLATGRWIAEHHAIPSAEPFTNTVPGKPWIPQQWLSELIFWWAHEAGGIRAVQALVALLVTATCALHLATLRRAGVTAALPCLAYLLFLDFLFTPRVQMRPDVINMLLVAVLFRIATLADWRLGRRHAIAIGALTILWANLHAGGSVLAPVFLATAAAAEAVGEARRRGALFGGARARGTSPGAERVRGLALAALVAFVALAATPAGWKRLLFPWEVWRESTAGVFVSEWSPLFDVGEATFRPAQWVVPVVIQAFLIVLWLRPRAAPWAEGAAAALLGLMGVGAARFTHFFWAPAHFVLRGLAAADATSAAAARVARPLLVVWCVVLAALIWNHDVGLWQDGLVRRMRAAGIAPFAPVYEPNYPVGAARFLERVRLDGRMYNMPAWGGYLAFHLHPNYPISSDGRIELYGREIARDMNAIAANQDREALLAKYGFDFLVVDGRFFAPARPAAEHWRLVFSEGNARVYLRDSERNAANFERCRADAAARGGG